MFRTGRKSSTSTPMVVDLCDSDGDDDTNTNGNINASSLVLLSVNRIYYTYT